MHFRAWASAVTSLAYCWQAEQHIGCRCASDALRGTLHLQCTADELTDALHLRFEQLGPDESVAVMSINVNVQIPLCALTSTFCVHRRYFASALQPSGFSLILWLA